MWRPPLPRLPLGSGRSGTSGSVRQARDSHHGNRPAAVNSRNRTARTGSSRPGASTSQAARRQAASASPACSRADSHRPGLGSRYRATATQPRQRRPPGAVPGEAGDPERAQVVPEPAPDRLVRQPVGATEQDHAAPIGALTRTQEQPIPRLAGDQLRNRCLRDFLGGGAGRRAGIGAAGASVKPSIGASSAGQGWVGGWAAGKSAQPPGVG
jgi:hypothetical protein